jgi:hypothetical protein
VGGRLYLSLSLKKKRRMEEWKALVGKGVMSSEVETGTSRTSEEVGNLLWGKGLRAFPRADNLSQK